MNPSKRKVNRNLFYSKLHGLGLTLEKMGQKFDPPITRFRVWQIVNTPAPDHRLKQVAAILGTNIQTLFPKNQ